MFDIQYMKNKQLHLYDFIVELENKINRLIEEENYQQALMPTLELRDMIINHFSYSHPYRGFIYKQTGFLYYVMGLWEEGKKEINRALKIFKRSPKQFPVDIFECHHLLFEIALLEGEKEAIILATEPLLNDPQLNVLLEIRIYLSLAEQYIFGHGKDLRLTRDYLFWAKYLLTIHNLTNGLEYAHLLYLYARYQWTIGNEQLALSFLEQLQVIIHNDELPNHKTYHLYRLSNYLKKQIVGKSTIPPSTNNDYLLIN